MEVIDLNEAIRCSSNLCRNIRGEKPLVIPKAGEEASLNDLYVVTKLTIQYIHLDSSKLRHAAIGASTVTHFTARIFSAPSSLRHMTNLISFCTI